MKQFILKHKKAITGTGIMLLLGVAAFSFQDSPLVRQRPEYQVTDDDTIPEKNQEGAMKMKDFDKLTEDLDKGMLNAETAIRKIDLSGIGEAVEKALKNVDMKKIMLDAQVSIESIDFDKILSDVRSSLKEVDWNKAGGEVDKAMLEAKKEIEKAKIEIRDIDKDEIKKAMEEAREELQKAKTELKGLDMDKIMEEARDGISKAKKELSTTKAMFTEMEKDGLIDRSAGFSIEYRDKELFINGKKQTEEVTDKYRKYFSHDHFKIKIDKD